MAEPLLKQEVSLTVLKVRLLEAPLSSAGDVAVETTTGQPSPSDPSVLCELEVTGNAEERGFAPAAAHPTTRSTSRRKRGTSRPTYAECEDVSTVASRIVAQWSFAAEEIQVPLQFTDAKQFRDKPSVAGEVIANFTRAAVGRIFSEFRADAFERFASIRSWLPSGKPTLPSAMARELNSLLPSLLQERDCLWLELAEPIGYLPLLPWEELLRSVTSAPILRLSPHSIKAVSPERELSAVLCVTVPSREWLPSVDHLTSLARAICQSLPERSTLHVFADDLCHALFAAANEKLGNDDDQGRHIKFWPLPIEQPGSGPENENRSEQPWMTWLTASLAGRAVDIVHCLCPGMLLPDHARLVIARDAAPPLLVSAPSATEGAATGRALNYISPSEHSELLTTLGAWAAIFSAPAAGQWMVESRQGIRVFVDQFARARPGVAVFHDLEADPACEALAETYRFIIGDSSVPAATSSSVSVAPPPGTSDLRLRCALFGA